MNSDLHKLSALGPTMTLEQYPKIECPEDYIRNTAANLDELGKIYREIARDFPRDNFDSDDSRHDSMRSALCSRIVEEAIKFLPEDQLSKLQNSQSETRAYMNTLDSLAAELIYNNHELALQLRKSIG